MLSLDVVDVVDRGGAGLRRPFAPGDGARVDACGQVGALDAGRVEHVRAALTTAGSRSFVDDLATQQLREATTLAEDLGLPPELVTWVGEVAGSLEGGVA